MMAIILNTFDNYYAMNGVFSTVFHPLADKNIKIGMQSKCGGVLPHGKH